MADELDPRLEARLREALHAEADALPLLIREQDVLRARDRRRTRRWALPASLLGAAAVVAVLIASGVFGHANPIDVAGSPSPSAAARPLASYEDLTVMLGADADRSATLHGEHPDAEPGGPPVTVELGTMSAAAPIAYAVHCLGGHLDLSLDTGDGTPDTLSIECSSQPFAAAPTFVTGPVRITATAPASVRWRIVLAPVASASPRPLATYEELARMLDESIIVPWTVAAQGEGPAAGAGDGKITTVLGTVGAYHFIDFALDCTGGDIEIRVMSGDIAGFGYKSACDQRPTMITDGMGSSDPQTRVEVVATKDVRWRVIVEESAPASGEPGVPPSLPPVPALGFGSTLLTTASGGSGEPALGQTVQVPEGATLVVPIACAGTGFVQVDVDGITAAAACLEANTWQFVPAGPVSSITTWSDGTATFNLEVRASTEEQRGASFVPPAAILSADGSSASGYHGCGGTWAKADGTSDNVTCGPDWYAIPEGRALHVGVDGVIGLTLPTGWSLTNATVGYVPFNATVPLSVGGEGERLVAVPSDGVVVDGLALSAPALGDWALRVTVSGTADDGTTFTAIEFFRAIVIHGV